MSESSQPLSGSHQALLVTDLELSGHFQPLSVNSQALSVNSQALSVNSQALSAHFQELSETPQVLSASDPEGVKIFV